MTQNLGSGAGWWAGDGRRCVAEGAKRVKNGVGLLTPQHGAVRSPMPLTLLPYTLGWKDSAARLVHAALGSTP